MPSRYGHDQGHGPSTASEHAAAAVDLDAGAADAERMAAEWEADGRPEFATRRRELARRLRTRAAEHWRAAGLPAGERA
jgi:hypothetical protein